MCKCVLFKIGFIKKVGMANLLFSYSSGTHGSIGLYGELIDILRVRTHTV